MYRTVDHQRDAAWAMRTKCSWASGCRDTHYLPEVSTYCDIPTYAISSYIVFSSICHGYGSFGGFSRDLVFTNLASNSYAESDLVAQARNPMGPFD